MNFDLGSYFCPDCGHRVTVTHQDHPRSGGIEFRVAFHRDSVENVVYSQIREAIEEIRAKAHPVGQVQYDGVLPEGVQYVRLPVYSNPLSDLIKSYANPPDRVFPMRAASPKPECKPAYPPTRKILL